MLSIYNSQLCPLFQIGVYAESWTGTIPVKTEPRIQRKSRPPQSAPTTAGNLGAYKFLCEICKKAFADKRCLSDHVRRHEGKSHRCDLCPKSFATYRGLELHTPVHTGKYPFPCDSPGCTWGFNFRKMLEAHQAEQHGKPLTPLNCKYCSKAFFDIRRVGPHEEKCITHY